MAGSLLVLGTWWVRWRRIAAIARAASIVECGDEVDTLRRVERRVGVRRPITLVASDAAMEPGVFGIVRPVLLWSGTIGRHLNGEQVETIFAHELSHVRRRDNLAAAIHMVVEAMLWFHPLVWWIGTRLVDERERACDEAVLVSGHRPEVYAESILKACRLYVESPLPCVAGVTGSDLRKRIERIMSNSTTERLTRWRRLLLTACVLAPLAAPVLLGAASTPRKRVEISSVRMFGPNAPAAAGASQAGPTQSSQQFEVASIKPNKSNDGRVMIGVQPGGRFTATNVTLKMLIRNAYQLQDFQIAGGPDWMSSDHFDVVAKAEGGDDIGDPFRAEKQGEPSRGQLMLRQLLEERFKLQTHKEDRSSQSTHSCSRTPMASSDRSCTSPRPTATPREPLVGVGDRCGQTARRSRTAAPYRAVFEWRPATWSSGVPASASSQIRWACSSDASSSIAPASPARMTSISPGRPTTCRPVPPARPRRRSIQTDRQSSPRCRNSSGSSSIRRRARSASS